MEWEDVKHNKDIALFLKKIRGKGGGSMIKETIQAVEDAEAKASELVAQASEDARRVKAEAEAEADRMLAEGCVVNQLRGFLQRTSLFYKQPRIFHLVKHLYPFVL